MKAIKDSRKAISRQCRQLKENKGHLKAVNGIQKAIKRNRRIWKAIKGI